MKIDPNIGLGGLRSTLVPQGQDAKAAERSHDPERVAGDDSEKSDVSRLGRMIADASAAAAALPDVRAERVALARQRLADGFYDTPEARETLIDRLAAMVRGSAS